MLGCPPPICLQLAHLGAVRTQNYCLPLTWGPGPSAHSPLWSGALSGSPRGVQVEGGAGVPGREPGSGLALWPCVPQTLAGPDGLPVT